MSSGPFDLLKMSGWKLEVFLQLGKVDAAICVRQVPHGLKWTKRTRPLPTVETSASAQVSGARGQKENIAKKNKAKKEIG